MMMVGNTASSHHSRHFSHASNVSHASQSTIFDESVPSAVVIWWDNSIVCVRCPYCRGRHTHRTHWNNRRPAHQIEVCPLPVSSSSKYAKAELPYQALYPFQSIGRTGLALGWEIDKDTGRYITVGIEKNEAEDWDTDYSNDDETSDCSDEYCDNESEQHTETVNNKRTNYINGGAVTNNPDVSTGSAALPHKSITTRRTQSISSLTDGLQGLVLGENVRLPVELCLLMDQMQGLGIVEADERPSPNGTPFPSTPPHIHRRSTTSPSIHPMLPSTPKRPPLIRDMVQTEPRIKTASSISIDIDPFSSPKAGGVERDAIRPIMLEIEPSTWIQSIDASLDELSRERRRQLGSRYFSLIRRNDITELRLLLDLKRYRRSNPFTFQDRRGNTGLILAARRGHMKIVELLCNKSTVEEYIDKRNKYGRTALMEAALWGHLNILEYLLSQNADPNLEDKRSRTALTLATNTTRNNRERSQRSKSSTDIPPHIRTRILLRLRTHMQSCSNENKTHPFAQFPSVSRRNFSTSESFFSTSKFGLSTTHSSRKQTAETTHFKLPDQYKTIGRLDRGPLFPVWYALSGYSHSEYSPHVLDNNEWTEKARELRDAIRWWPQNKSYASHVEPQLVAFYISKHVLLDGEHEGLQKVMPPMLPQAEVLVSQAEPCGSCGAFLEKVKRHLKISVEVKKNEPKDDNCKIIIRSEKEVDDFGGTTLY